MFEIPTKTLHIAYCGNDKVFPLILLSSLSVVRHTPGPIVFYLVTMDLTDADARYTPITEEHGAIMETAVRAWNRDCGVRILRADALYAKYLRGGKNENFSYTPYALLRLLFTEFNFGGGGCIIYLDADTMCCGNMRAFEEYDIGSYEFAAVLDHMGKFWIRRDYINSGVLYLNLEKIRETGFFERAREQLFRKKYLFADQTVINKYGRKGKLILPRRFNEQREIHEDTVIKHFCRGIRWLPFFKVYNFKQSDVANAHKFGITCFDDVYAEYDLLAEKYGLEPLTR